MVVVGTWKMKITGKSDLMSLSSVTLRRIPQESYVLVDIRPRVEYNTNHIKSSVNIHCSPLLFRRFERGNKPIDNLLLSEENRGRIQRDSCSIIVLYDNGSQDGVISKEIRQMANVLRSLKRNRSLFFLHGGLKCFNEEYPQHCESTPLCLPTNPQLPAEYFRDPTDQMQLGPREPEPVSLLSHLFIGNAQHAGDREVLERLGITAIMNVSKSCRNNFEGKFTYKTIPVDDSFSEDIARYFTETSSFIDSVREGNGKVLVHCRAGISRSATICLAYLISRFKLSLDKAYEFMKKKKAFISPNFGFMGQLLSLESDTNIKCENRLEVAQTPLPGPAKRTTSSPRSPLVTSSAENAFSPAPSHFAYPPVTVTTCAPFTFFGGNNDKNPCQSATHSYVA